MPEHSLIYLYIPCWFYGNYIQCFQLPQVIRRVFSEAITNSSNLHLYSILWFPKCFHIHSASRAAWRSRHAQVDHFTVMEREVTENLLKVISP